MATNTYYSPFFPAVELPGAKGTTIAAVPSADFGLVKDSVGSIEGTIKDLDQAGFTDGIAPDIVTGLALSSSIALDADGKQIVTLTATWTASPAKDLNRYDLAISENGGAFVEFTTGKTSTSYNWQVRSGRSFSVKIRAIDNAGNPSSYSNVVTTTSARDNIPPANPTALTVDATFQSFILRWSNPADPDLEFVEIWEGSTNALGTAAKLSTVFSAPSTPGVYIRSGIPTNTTRFYWLRAIDTSGNPSGYVGPISATTAGVIDLNDFTPGLTPIKTVATLPSATGYVGPSVVFNQADGRLYRYANGAWVKSIDTGTDFTDKSIDGSKLVDTSVGTAKIADGALTTAKFATNVVPIEVLGSLPTTGNFQGRQVFLTTDGKLYRYSGSAFVTSVASTDISGTITNAQIASVSAEKILGDATNFIPNGTFDPSSAPVATSASTTVVSRTDTGVPAGCPYPYAVKLTQRDHRPFPSMTRIRAKQGDKIVVSAWAALGKGTAAFNLYWGRSPVESAGNYSAFTVTGSKSGTASDAGTWTKVTGVLTVPAIADGQFIEPFLQIEQNSPWGTEWYVTDWQARRQTTAEQIADNILDASKFAAGVRPVERVSTLPAAGTQGRIVLLTTDNKLYRDTGSAWTSAVPTSDLTGTVGTALIADLAINKDKLAEAAVETSKIAGGAVDLSKFSTGLRPIERVTSLPAAGTSGRVVLLTTDNKLYRDTGSAWTKETDGADIKVASISTDAIAANSITASKILVGDTSNMIKNPTFGTGTTPSLDGWSFYSGGTVALPATDSSVPAGCPAQTCIRIPVTPSITDLGCNPIYFPVTPGEVYYMETWYATSADFNGAGGNGLGMTMYDANRANVSYPAIISVGGAPTTFSVANTTWTRLQGTITIPATVSNNAVAGVMQPRFTVRGQATNPAGFVFFTKLVMRRASTGELIVDGVITANKIATDAVVADKIQANAITSVKINANAVTADKITAGAITTDKLDALAVTAGKLAAGSVTAEKIVASAISADKIAANAVTTEKLLIADTNNYVENPDFAAGDLGWIKQTNSGQSLAIIAAGGSDVYQSGYVGAIFASSSGGFRNKAQLHVTPGDRLYGYMAVKGAGTGNFAPRIAYLDRNGAEINKFDTGTASPFNGSYTVLEIVDGIVPAGAALARIEGFGTANANSLIYVGAAGLMRRTTGKLIVDGEISTDKLAVNAVTAGKIAADSIDASKIKANVITANKLTMGVRGVQLIGITFDTDRVSIVSWTGGKIVWQSDDGLTYNTTTITGNSVAWSGALVYIWWNKGGNQFYAGSSPNGANPDDVQIAQYDGGTRLYQTYGGTVIDGNSVKTGTIVTGHMTAGTINGDRITVNTLNADRIVANSIQAGQIKAGTITATEMATNSITATKIAITDFQNYAANGDFTLGNTGWNGIVVNDSANAYMGNWVIPLAPGSSVNKYGSNENVFSVKPGDSFYLEWYGKATSDMDASFNVYVRVNNAAGSQIATMNIGSITSAQTTYTQRAGALPDMPANAYSAYVQINWNNTKGMGYLGAVRLRRRNEGNLIVDGTITGNKIAAATIDAGNIKSNAITTGKLTVASRSLSTTGINFRVVNSVLVWDSGNVLIIKDDGTTQSYPVIKNDGVSWTGSTMYLVYFPGNGYIDYTIDVNYFRADTYVTLAVWRGGTDIATYGGVGTIISGDRIVTGTVNTNQLSANAVTAAKIATGTITANEIQSGTITAAQIATSALTARVLAVGNSDNVITDGDYRDYAWWGLAGQQQLGNVEFFDTTQAWSYFRRGIRFKANGSIGTQYSTFFPVEPGATYKLKVSTYVGPNFNASAGWFNPTLHIPNVMWMSMKTGTQYANNDPSVKSGAQSWTATTGASTVDTREFIVDLPANWDQRQLQVRFDGNIRGDTVEIAFSLTRVSDATLIKDGAITTNKITVGTLNGDRITTSTLDASAIKANTIMSGSVYVGNVNTTVASLGTTSTWSGVSGSNKPEDNATKGAPTGTTVGGTDAGTVAANANNAANVTLYDSANGGYTINNNRVTKTVDKGAWFGNVYSRESGYGSARVSGRLSRDSFLALDADRAVMTTNAYTALDYAWHCSAGSNNWQIWENNTVVWSGTSVSGGPLHTDIMFSIEYDGRTVKYYAEQSLVRSVDTVPNRRFYVGICTAAVGTSVDSVNLQTLADNSLANTDPAKRINEASTKINPGQILIQGGTTLSDWKNGGDSTEIRGGAIAANTISTNKLQVGARAINTEGIDFQVTIVSGGPELSWTSGYIQYAGDGGSGQSRSIAAGNTYGITKRCFIYWIKDESQFRVGTNAEIIMGNPDALMVATYMGGTSFAVTYGGTIIDGSRITTGTVTADKISATSLSSISANIGNLVSYNGSGGRTERDGNGARLYDNNGTLRMRWGFW